MRASFIVTALLFVPGCRTVETRACSSITEAVVRLGKRVRTWEVRCRGEVLGRVVLFQEKGLARDCVYFVKNLWDQDLGLVDGLGRAYRYLPHEEEPAWVGTGTVAVGARQILGASAPCELVEDLDGSPERVAPTAKSFIPPVPEAPMGPSGNQPEAGLPQSRQANRSKD
jgi:hypothetical protein